jgi:pimeloyl-ACP methyl ester carboxylesterase
VTHPDVHSGSARIAYDDTGSGPAVVLLHPGVADRRCWAATTEALVPRYRVIAYDQRGYGETQYQPEPQDLGADLAALLDALDVLQAALVANSRGGRIAIDFALASPDRVTALVLVAPAVRGAPAPVVSAEIEAMDAHIDALEEAGEIDALNAAEARFWLDGPSRPEGAVAGPARALFLDANRRALTAPDPGQEHEPDDDGAWARLPEIAVPVLAVVGAHDLPHFVERTHHIAHAVVDGTFVELPESAHLPQLDDPVAFNGVLGEFLDSVLLGTRA